MTVLLMSYDRECPSGGVLVNHYSLWSNSNILVHSGSTIIHTGDELLYCDNYHIVVNFVIGNI